ncbi:MAG: hypothetical protein IIU14_04265 [Ruminococcus sp.]|nr:hypothetical protein [Ruminococcus sp.]
MKKYQNPDLEVIRYNEDDVLTDSELTKNGAYNIEINNPNSMNNDKII